LFRRRSAYRAIIEADAKALIERYGERAYSEARERQHDGVSRPIALSILGKGESGNSTDRRTALRY
jgi:hypothetical protein